MRGTILASLFVLTSCTKPCEKKLFVVMADCKKVGSEFACSVFAIDGSRAITVPLLLKTPPTIGDTLLVSEDYNANCRMP